ncbi:MAG: hypothetical protein DRJ07_15875 [Bacteroidetes bacterium]|nr:MAG: hypothetical protein DRJ07_15875 [Bacteroidota bacterium]
MRKEIDMPPAQILKTIMALGSVDDLIKIKNFVTDQIKKRKNNVKTKIDPILVDKRLTILTHIAKDMEQDAQNFDGKPFDGKTVAEYFGNQGAAIAALANITQTILKDLNK